MEHLNTYYFLEMEKVVKELEMDKIEKGESIMKYTYALLAVLDNGKQVLN